MKTKKPIALLSVLLIASTTIIYALWSYYTSLPSRETVGVLELTVTGTNFSVDDLVPGDNITRIISVANTGNVSGSPFTISVVLTSDPQNLSKYLEVVWFGKDTKVVGGPWWYTIQPVTWCDYPGLAIDRAFTGQDNMTQAVKTSTWTSTYASWYTKLDEFPNYISLYDLKQILSYSGSTAPEPGEYHQVYLKLQLRKDTPTSLMGATLNWELGFTLNQRAGRER